MTSKHLQRGFNPEFMNRIELQEMHDHPAFPGFLRNLVTDGLQSLWEFGNSYKPILGRLLVSMNRARTLQVLDLCSGGGGPWLRLAREPAVRGASAITVRLTDKYPNWRAFERASSVSKVLCYEYRSTDATTIPTHLEGFRTIFSSFHHFGRDQAVRMLEDAMECQRGIGVFEVAQRSLLTMLAIFLIPALSWFLAPTIRPFSWSRLLWTYLIPVVPFVLWYDGIVSCFRAYSRKELEEMLRPLRRRGYRWHIGEDRSGFLPVTYVVGYPVLDSASPDNV
jgi:hypothetical protein